MGRTCHSGRLLQFISENKNQINNNTKQKWNFRRKLKSWLKLRIVFSSVWVIVIIQLSYCCYSIKTSFYENDLTILHINLGVIRHQS